jgi:chemotaxis signal transduction protein
MTPRAAQVDLVLFTIGQVRYGADLTQVRRIDIHEPNESVGTPLGPCAGHRALVFSAVEGFEHRLRVDQVHGVRRVSADSLRRMPRVVAAPPLSLGAWLDGDQPVVLIDLHALAPTSPRSP